MQWLKECPAVINGLWCFILRNASIYFTFADESGDLLNITESSSDDLLDDSTFLPSESLLFTPEKFDRCDEEIGNI